MVLGVFKQFLANVANWSADASHGKLDVSVGAVLLDQEIYGDGSSLDPAIRRATTQKNNLYYSAARQAFSAAEIIQYNRGGWMPCGPNEPVCPEGYRNGTEGDVCTYPSLVSRPFVYPAPCTFDGWYRDWWYTLEPEELGDSLSLSVYTVPEIRATMLAFNRTVQTAAKLKLKKVVPWICLGCGFRRDVLYPLGGNVLYRTVWDYDVSYSFLLGAMMHEKLPWSGPPEPERYGDWSYAKVGVFFPGIVDTLDEQCKDGVNPHSPCTVFNKTEARSVRLRHFVAYVRGAALYTGNLSQGDPHCANATQMVLNQSCLKALYPPPPPPPPPLAATFNPLAGLPALPKPHYSWYRCNGDNCGNRSWSALAADTNATLIDYARITHA
jgi:hypothetical protein